MLRFEQEKRSFTGREGMEIPWPNIQAVLKGGGKDNVLEVEK